MARGKLERTKYLESSVPALLVALEAFNSPTNPYRFQSAILLMSNSVELIAKSVLLKIGKTINLPNSDKTITAEVALNRLLHYKEVDDITQKSLQQLISIRNEIAHRHIEKIDSDLAIFLMFSAFRFFEKAIVKHYPKYKNIFKDDFLSISTNESRTYADSVIGLIKSKRSGDRRLLYLLERGVRYDGSSYISQNQFEAEFKRNQRKRLENKAKIGEFITKADLLRVVFVQAPKSYSVDVTLGRNKNSSDILPVKVITALECDKNTIEIAEMVGVRQHDVVKFVKDNNIKGNSTYHQEIPNGKNPPLHRYSEKLAELMRSRVNT